VITSPVLDAARSTSPTQPPDPTPPASDTGQLDDAQFVQRNSEDLGTSLPITDPMEVAQEERVSNG
jgi:hypothetical protein